ncbi:hypothetical protein PVOR_24449 [Paenibacillus vortex V453]|uniref:Uncharacterized protein n=1 Tax=Paenibacillus vortex V453 TaxID=715225 RepID=A0A2R9SQ30_9BACL|nr:hypothetical protein [Paenibacillus vortex]EFU39487.1 hypothetical protein PVOR_24449 [Paenibacillus vortex V453]
MKLWNVRIFSKSDSPCNYRSLRYKLLSASVMITAILWLGAVNPLTSTAAASNGGIHGTPTSSSPILAQIPGSLVDFAEETVDHLAVHAPFTAWDEAEMEFTPLGPGTHGWLITISSEGIPQGYMIISAADDGSYILSEYGIGSTLPFSQAPLNERLAAEGLLKTGGVLPQGSIVRKLYDVSPVWQVQLPGKKPVYFSALNSEALPDEPQSSRIKALPTPLLAATKGIVTSTSSNAWLAETPNLSAAASEDPYDNLLWLTSAHLNAGSSADLRNLLQEHSALIFKSKKKQCRLRIPFQLNWLASLVFWESAESGCDLCVGSAAGERHPSLFASISSDRARPILCTAGIEGFNLSTPSEM